MGTVLPTTIFRDTIGVARGCSGCTCTPRAVKKNSGVIYRENV